MAGGEEVLTGAVLYAIIRTQKDAQSPVPRLACAMDYRPPLGAPRPRPPQRAVSGGSYGGHPLPKRPPLPSRLSSVRSASQPANLVDLTSDERARADGGGNMMDMGSQEVVKSPEVIEVDDDEAEQRPAKRAKTEGEEFQAAGEDGEEDKVDLAHEVMPGTALPSLPKTRPAAGRMGAYRRNRMGIEPSARKAHGLEPPAAATRVPGPKKVLDFSPWTGNHHEDVLNENIIKSGYFDKITGTNQSETNSAKPSIWPSLSQKNHAGLSALSYMYVAVMEKRQAMGKCTAPSTFKPPPRLAVQEAKRAKWLEDLADPSVSLRRLSKTIPHGIKGKLLMEQCLGKFIPLHRALWLVRGVGMHELRAFRRKGFNEAQAASGEVKWVREWTVNVTQFLEDVIATCGQPDWQKKMNYAVKLATALYSEKLLDADYYLDWIVSSLAECASERLPIWTIITQIHWKDLTKFGRRGRRLVEGILEHLRELTENGSPANAMLRTSLQKMLTVLAVAKRGCLILPRTWEKYKGLLSPRSSPPVGSPASDLSRRNERLAAPLTKTPGSTRSAYLDLYETLDSVGLDLDMGELAWKCVAILSDPTRLVPALLDWASSRFRTGLSRIYLAARIIAHVQEAGHDTDTIILQYLDNAPDVTLESEDLAHRVVVELVRLQAFSVGRYLQWLIASGALYSQERRHATGLIAALPTTGLPVHVVNTRNMLMTRLGHAVDERKVLQVALGRGTQVFAGNQDGAPSEILLPADITKAASYSLAQQLAEKATSFAKDGNFSLDGFCSLRNMIERIGDINSLASLVSAASSSDMGALLATAADTVNLHASTFAALDQLMPLVDRLADQHLALRSNQPLDRSFILALSSLAKRIPGKASLVKLLKDDLAHLEAQTSPAACSPASDSVIDMHAANLDSDEDVDAVFASGNVMDEQLMQRVFSRVVQRADKRGGDGGLTRVCGWLEQLRTVDGSAVLGSIVNNYLRNALTGPKTASLSIAAIAALSLSGCTSLESVTGMAKEVKDSGKANRLLEAFISGAQDLDLDGVGRYRFRLQQERCQISHAGDLLRVLRTAFGSDIFGSNEDVVRFVIQSGTTHEKAISDLFSSSSASDQLLKNAGALLTDVLGRDSGYHTNVSSIIATATPLSVRFSVAAKQLGSLTAQNSSDTKEAILQAFEEQSEVWPQLLAVCDEGTMRALREKAQEKLLQLVASGELSNSESAEEESKRTLDLLAVTSNTSQKPDTSFMAVLVERLGDLHKQFSAGAASSKPGPAVKDELLRRLTLVLQMATLSILSANVESEPSQQALSNLLRALCALLVHPELQLNRATTEHLGDLASALSDALPEPALSALKSKLPPDDRLTFILGGTLNTPTPWLALATHIPSSSTAGGTTQQQRALARHPSASSSQQQAPAQQKAAPPRLSVQPSPAGWPAAGGKSGPPGAEVKMTPFPLRQWEIISDPASVVGENDTSLGLGLFGLRKV